MKIETASNVVEIECECCLKRPYKLNSVRRRPSIYYGKSKKEGTNTKAEGFEEADAKEEKSNAKESNAEGGASS